MTDGAVVKLFKRSQEEWQADVFPGKGGDFHGLGRTPSEALVNAALAWHRTERKCDDQVN